MDDGTHSPDYKSCLIAHIKTNEPIAMSAIEDDHTRKEDVKDESRNELAQDRTEWAQQRTLLAKERTFSAWGRTGLAAIAAGLAIARLLGVVEKQWVALFLGGVLIFTGGLIFLLGFFSYRKALQKLSDQGIRGTPLWAIGLITGLLVISTILAMVLIFTE